MTERERKRRAIEAAARLDAYRSGSMTPEQQREYEDTHQHDTDEIVDYFIDSNAKRVAAAHDRMYPPTEAGR